MAYSLFIAEPVTSWILVRQYTTTYLAIHGKDIVSKSALLSNPIFGSAKQYVTTSYHAERPVAKDASLNDK